MPAPAEPPAHVPDERTAAVVREAVAETLRRHGADPEGAVALELRARVLAELFWREPEHALRPPDQSASASELLPGVRAGVRAAAVEDVPATTSPPTVPDDPLAWKLRERLDGLGREHQRWPELRELLVQLALRAPAPAPDPEPLAEPLCAEERETLDLLRRRVAKVERALEEARAAIAYVSSLETLDAGIASLYRSVQGLAPSDPHYAAKRGMLELVYRANVELRRKAG
jgi:hypothetical protein